MSVRDVIILGSSSQQPTRFRNHGAYLVRWNNEGLLFDPGEGTQRQFIFANVAPTVVLNFHLILMGIIFRLSFDVNAIKFGQSDSSDSLLLSCQRRKIL